MPDKKISQLTGASTPLGGTEEVPLVQSGSTKKVTVDNLTKGRTVNATTFDTDVAAAGVTLSGTTLSADGTNTNIDINITPKGTGEVNVTKIDVDGGTIDGTVIGGASAAAGTFTTLQHNNYQRWTINRSTQANQFLTLVWAGTKVFKGIIRIGVSYPFSSTAARAYHEFEIDANTAAGGGRVVYLRHDFSHADTTNYQGRVYYDSTTGTLTVSHFTVPNVEQDAVVEVFLTQGTMPDATPSWTTTTPAGTLQTASLEVINANVIVNTGNLNIGGTLPSASGTGSPKIFMLNDMLVVSGRASVPSPYTQNLQIDIVWANWGNNPIITLVDLVVAMRQYASTSGAAFGKIFATNSANGATLDTFTTTDVTTSRCAVTAASGGNYTLRLTINPTGDMDAIGYTLTIPTSSGGTGTGVSSITVSLV